MAQTGELTGGTDPEPGPLGLVMGGGGARAAYQVGFLRALARAVPDLEVPIITGVSAGAINAAHLASHPGTFREAVEDLAKLWESLTMEQVFRISPGRLSWNVLRWGMQLVSGGLGGPPTVRGLVDTAPLRTFLETALGVTEGRIPGIDEKARAGRLRAVAISTSSYSTGQSVTWVQGSAACEWLRPQRRGKLSEIGVDHVMASAALPLFFPAVQIGNEWYGDGGIRLSAPLSPALHLGAKRILAISTRFRRLPREEEEPVIHQYPPPAQVIGALMNSVFLDLLDQDAWRVELMNDLLRRMEPEARGDLQVVRLLTLRPSRDLGRLAGEFELGLPRTFRFLVRGLGTRQTKSPDLLSFLLFQPGYLRLLLEIGEKDGEARMGEIEELVRGESRGEKGTVAAGTLTSSPQLAEGESPPPRPPLRDS
jgi:NTE family protein